MGRRVILDTNLLIDYERGAVSRSRLDDDDIAVAAITIAEYRTGIELAENVERANERVRALDAITGAVEVLAYTHAAQTGRVLLSRDAAARFGSLPGVTAEQSW